MCTTSQLEIDKFEFEKLKFIYDKATEQTKFYLSWRQALLAGYCAILSALFFATYSLHIHLDQRIQQYAIYSSFAISIISLLFILLDERISDLFNSCLSTGESIEAKLKLSDYGLCKKLNNTKNSKTTHTWTIRLFFVICFVTGIILGVNFS